jgi:3-keto-disaccharide hydrolase/PA14 domain
VSFIIGCVLFAAISRAEPQPDFDPGVTFRIYRVEPDLESIPKLSPDQTPNFDELRPTIDFEGDKAFGNQPASFLSTASGLLLIENAGVYHFRLTSDDGSRLFIDQAKVIDNDGRHAAKAATSADVRLSKGSHRLLVEHFDHGGNKKLKLEWEAPDSRAFETVPTAALRTERDLTRVTSPGFKKIDDGRRPGDGKPVEGIHPAWKVTTIRPEGFEPMVGAMCFDKAGRLIVGSFKPLQRDDRTLPDIDSKQPDKLFAVSGATGDPKDIKVSMCADGLYEPLGLCAVGDDLYVSHRKEITRLIDKNHDGFYETHETVADGWEGWNYHQFCFGLVHRDGKLYATLSTAMAPPPWEGMGTNAAPNGPMRGGVIEVDLSSNTGCVIAGGLRAPNGIGLGPGGSLFYLDNQGVYMPTSQLCEVIPGRFYGHYNRTNFVPKLADRFPQGGVPSVFCDRPRTPAAVWLPHNELSNSPTQPQLITGGLYDGQMFVGELTGGGIRRVCLEKINGQWQGAVFQFTQGLECGVNRLIWGPDGCLYAGGIGAGGNWNWHETKFGLQRLSPTGKTAFEILAVRAQPDGFELEFTQPIDPAWLAGPANYAVEQWTYKPTAEYGGPKIDVEPLRAKLAVPSNSGRRVVLSIDGLKEGRCIHFRVDPTSIHGEPIWATEAWYTLSQIPRKDPAAHSTIAGAPIDPDDHGMGVGTLPPAGAATLIGASADPVFRHRPEKELPREGGRSGEELMALPGWVAIDQGKGDLMTGSVFGDCRLHIEWLCPPGGEGQMGANSGVYLQDLYEIQVLGTPAGGGRLNPDDAGAIYKAKAPDVNASAGPGAWQAYDIWFAAPRFEGARKTKDARVTLYWNGVLVHNDVAVTGPTGSRAKQPEAASRDDIQVGPLVLQDHPSAAEGPVRFRNVWIGPLAQPRFAEGAWEPLVEGADADGLPKGWVVRGGKATYRVENGEVVGTTAPNSPNTFLVTQREYSDFELLAEFKTDPGLNSGVQIRSQVAGGFDKRDGPVRGPQVEIDPSERAYTAGLYDEARRGWLYRMIDAPYARRTFKQGEWNRLRILAEGPVVQTWINGVPAAAAFDALDARGHIALQVHGVGAEAGPLEVRFRNMRVRELRPQ